MGALAQARIARQQAQRLAEMPKTLRRREVLRDDDLK